VQCKRTLFITINPINTTTNQLPPPSLSLMSEGTWAPPKAPIYEDQDAPVFDLEKISGLRFVRLSQESDEDWDRQTTKNAHLFENARKAHNHDVIRLRQDRETKALHEEGQRQIEGGKIGMFLLPTA
jgi:hypothetical protein